MWSRRPLRIALAAAALAGVLACWLMPVAQATTSDAERGDWFMAALDRAARRPPVAYTAIRSLRAELVDKHEQAWMNVMTEFHPDHGLRYTVLAQGGSDRIRDRALVSLLQKEVDATQRPTAATAAFSTDNYRYALSDARSAIRIALTPLRRDERLITGTATLDGQTAALVHVEGQLARSPSFWLKDVQIQRRYAAIAGTTLPVSFSSTAHVRMFGTARLQMTIHYLTVAGQRRSQSDTRGDAPPLAPGPSILPTSLPGTTPTPTPAPAPPR